LTISELAERLAHRRFHVNELELNNSFYSVCARLRAQIVHTVLNHALAQLYCAA
jgi:hypothetical protein